MSASDYLAERKLRFVGHCQRAVDQPVSELLFWDHTRVTGGKCSRGAGVRPNYAKRLLKECECVGVMSDIELGSLMLDRTPWRDRIPFIVSQNYN